MMACFIGDLPMWWLRGHQLSNSAVNTANARSTLAFTVTLFFTDASATLVISPPWFPRRA